MTRARIDDEFDQLMEDWSTMNTLDRPRKRPRKLSVNFRTLWWLLVREAFVRVYYRTESSRCYQHQLDAVRSSETHRLIGRASQILRYQPERRYYP
jgi:hypothetical protein